MQDVRSWNLSLTFVTLADDLPPLSTKKEGPEMHSISSKQIKGTSIDIQSGAENFEVQSAVSAQLYVLLSIGNRVVA